MSKRNPDVALDRPSYHFTPPRNWLNDPNGLVYLDEQYHLFYQHNPVEDRFGPPHWGHATSRDLILWEDHPIALEPDELGWVFSGSAVIDTDNTAGFGAGAIVAVFTHHLAEGVERQSLAYSTDGGETFDKYEGNPVLEPPRGETDFRDPRVFWWEQDEAGHWVMLLVVGDAVWVYTSDDLIHWVPVSRFNPNPGSARVWECPDLMKLPVAGTADHRWLMTVGIDGSDASQPYGTQYWIGDFDGRGFTADDPSGRWADQGADFYALQSWTAAPHGRDICIGWMSNWGYAGDTPTKGWRGQMTIPRRLGIAETPEGLRLTQTPIGGLDDARVAVLADEALMLSPGIDPLVGTTGAALDLVLNIDLDRSTAAQLRLAVRVGEDESTDIVLDLEDGILTVDRSHAGRHPLHRNLARSLPVSVGRNGVVDIRVLVDAFSVEVLAKGGLVSITQQIFPAPSSTGMSLGAIGGVVAVDSLAVHEIRGSARINRTVGKTVEARCHE